MTKTQKQLLQATDDEARIHAKTMIRTARHGALALVDPESGQPLASRVGLATDLDGAPVFLMSSLSGRADALRSDSRASLLIGDVGKGDPLAQARITLVGNVHQVADGDDRARIRRRYLARHPKSKLYIDFKDFSFWRFAIERASLLAGFGRAYRLTSEDIAPAITEYESFAEMEEGAVTHMNEDHGDAVGLYATKLCDAPDGKWRMTGFDPEGIDLMCGDDARRLFFDAPLASPKELRPVLVALAKKARSHA